MPDRGFSIIVITGPEEAGFLALLLFDLRRLRIFFAFFFFASRLDLLFRLTIYPY